MADFKFTNALLPVPSPIPHIFSIPAPPSTDIWRKPPSTHSFNAPILHRTIPLSSFKKARVNVSGPWTALYDQGGLLLAIDGGKQWVKTGVELVGGKAQLSTVACDRWADWSLRELGGHGGQEGTAASVEMSREEDGSLWVYLIEGVERTPIREVTWIFEGQAEKECWVGVYAARPAKEDDDLQVKFANLVIDTE